jgi:hypothetical protein
VKRVVLLLVLVAVAGCTDIATRIRAEVEDAHARLESSQQESVSVTLRPNHFPDGCQAGAGYRLVIRPYSGGKQVPAGDIDVFCNGWRHYYTGLSEKIRVPGELSVEKKADDEIRVTLRKTSAGAEIARLE